MFDFLELPHENYGQVGSDCEAKNLFLVEYTVEWFGRIDKKKVLVAATSIKEAIEVSRSPGEITDVNPVTNIIVKNDFTKSFDFFGDIFGREKDGTLCKS